MFRVTQEVDDSIRLLIRYYNLTERTSAHGQTGHVGY